jgi:RHS repeat-associated protein
MEQGYDQAGDVTIDVGAGNQYLYDGDGRICAVASPNPLGGTTLTGYLYDAEGTRVAKGNIAEWSCDPATSGLTGSTTTNDYILGLSGEQFTEMGVDANHSLVWQHTNVWAGGKLLATYDGATVSGKDETGGLHFYFDDPLGSRRVQTDYAGNIEKTCSSLPYGDAESCAPTPTENLFTGKERDAESGNDYFGARYYSSAMGRFMSPDWSVKIEPVPYSKLDDPQSLNLYAYVLNNPLGETDPDGHADEHSPPWLSSKAREYIFAALHPGIAHQIGNVVPHQGVTNISTNAVRFSTDLGLQENASHEGSQVNAVRHTIWSATMTSKWGSDVAQGVGNAHEDNPNVDLSIRTFTGKNAMDQADQSVDLLNNQIGQQIGSDHPDQSMPELTSAVLDYYHTNGLYTATPGADGTVNISQTKLSDQQYQSAKQSLSKMNDNGFKQ